MDWQTPMALAVVASLISTRVFGHAEFLLIRKRLTQLILSFLHIHGPGQARQIEAEVADALRPRRAGHRGEAVRREGVAVVQNEAAQPRQVRRMRQRGEPLVSRTRLIDRSQENSRARARPRTRRSARSGASVRTRCIASAIAFGLANVAVPTWTAAQPATRNSSASSAWAIPPIPITGIRTARAAWCARCTASGRIAGPDRPPVLKLKRGR